ncbi:MAG: regulatory iron-sulfur-containing complex subunit RicT [Saprospiraceae bacterium]
MATQNGEPAGCRSNGGCSSGGCNRLNTYDWLTAREISDVDPFDIVEVSFKNGSHKGFYVREDALQVSTGDMAVVETGNGYDIGKVSLSGDLVRLQMKKKKVNPDAVAHKVIRKAHERDMERLAEARSMEKATMIRSRVIARTLGLEMKIGDVEYQGDKRKATFYYTADGRVDFRELIRHYAKEFRVKIEMRQIGARQESARIGGLGSCGRELCCSTWLSDFKSVSTAAARYQNLAINQSKLSGQCGRLKCCLNYELDTYLDALEKFPRNADKLRTQTGMATLIKTDIFKGLMYYISEEGKGKTQIYTMTVAEVKQVQAMNAAGNQPLHLKEVASLVQVEEPVMDFEDVTGAIELPEEIRKKKRRNRGRNKKRSGSETENNQPGREPKTKKQEKKVSQPKAKQGNTGQEKTVSEKPAGKDGQSKEKSNSKRRNRYRKGRKNNRNDNNSDNKKGE